MARYTDDSKDRVRDAVDMVDLVGLARRAAPGRRQPLRGPVPVPRRAHAVVRDRPGREALPLLRLRRGRRRVHLRAADRGPGLQGALEFLADRYGVELELAEEDPRRPSGARERERLLELLERTAAFYVRYLWESEEAARAREYLAGRGLDEGALREFRVGYAPSAWDTVLLASRRAGFSDRELDAAGLAQRSQKEGRTYDRFRRRIMFPLCDLRGRVLGFGARAMGADQQPKYLNTSDNAGLPQGPPPLRRRPRAVAGGEGGRGDRRRGLHRRDRAAPGRAAQRGRAHGHGADRRAGRRARAPGADGPARARRRRRRAGGDAARRAGRGAAQARRCASCRCRSGSDPADLVAAEGARAMADRVEASVPVRALPRRARAGRRRPVARRGQGRGRSRRCARSSATLPASAMREELVALVADRTDLAPALVASWLAQARRRAAAAAPAPRPARRPQRGRRRAPPALDAAGRAERTFLAQRRRPGPPGARRSARSTPTPAFSSELTRRAAAHLRRAAGREATPRPPPTTTSSAHPGRRARGPSRAACAPPRRRSRPSASGSSSCASSARPRLASPAPPADLPELVARRATSCARRLDAADARALEETHAQRVARYFAATGSNAGMTSLFVELTVREASSNVMSPKARSAQK